MANSNNKEPLLEASAYQRGQSRDSMSQMSSSSILRTFILMAICFSANHGAVTACLALASSNLKDYVYLDADLGTWQTGTLYATYTLSAVFGAAPIVKSLGPRNGIFAGLIIYCVYVACFFVGAKVEGDAKWPVYIIGAAIGGIGGGFLWTAQGAYFGKTAEAYARATDITTMDATSYLGGVFAFFYLFEEVVLKMLSTFITDDNWGLGMDWKRVFAVYTTISVAASFGVLACHSFKVDKSDDDKPLCYKVTAATRLLTDDAKMKYMLPLNAVFGFTAAFLNSYVTSQVLDMAGQDSAYKGFFIAIPAAVAALLSLVLGPLAQKTGKGFVLIAGAVAFAVLAMVFVVAPEVSGYSLTVLIFIYILMGFGRATFEGTLRATFADFFKNNLEGAFANIILQSGSASGFAFFVFPHFTCKTESEYCVKFDDGSLHNVLLMELIIVGCAVLAVLCYLRANSLHTKELNEEEEKKNLYGANSETALGERV